MMPLWLEILLAVVGVLAAVGSAVAAMFAWLIAKRQLEPRIHVAIDQIEEGSTFFGIVMKNTGSSPAYTVKVKVDSRYRLVEEHGVLSDLKGAFGNTWPIISPGQNVAFALDRVKVWEERNSQSQLLVEATYAIAYGKKPRRKELFDVKPSWQEGQLIDGPGTWREVDSRVRNIVDSANRIEHQLGKIAQNLDEGNE